MITFFVPGIPVPKGSAKAFFRKGMRFPVVIQDNAAKQKPWANIISQTAHAHCSQPFAKAVFLTLEFHMPRPKAHYRKNGDLRPDAPDLHTKKPDLDKLLRCVKDALSGIAYRDDAQVYGVNTMKRYGTKPGVNVHINEYDEVPV